MSHVHVHAPHELTEAPEGDSSAPVGHGERLMELAAVLLLSLTTVATAWSGYQAARWSGEQSQAYATASATRTKAEQQTTQAGQLRIADLMIFNGWLDARGARDTKLQAFYRRRFSPELTPAFQAWLAQRPFTNPHAVPGPLATSQYHPAQDAQAAALSRRADTLFQAGTDAKANDDRYILSTVFFAAVLFFAGISLRVQWRPLRICVLTLAAGMLIGGAGLVLTLPVA